jgi:crotonobetainyl-CoA:carnitine CoA-transferase CaiB-like acyl-CoA transferase
MIDSERYWPAFCRAIGRPELHEDPRFANAVERFRNSAELVRLLDETFATRPLEKWIEPMNAERIIWAPVRTLGEAVLDEDAERGGCFATVDHPDYGPFKTVAPPLRMSGYELTGSAPAPLLAADTADVLAEAGVDDETIALLVSAVS